MAAFNCRSPKGFRPDLAVIGAGSAAAIRGAEPGANVSLVGHGTVGGTCVSIGCVPSKTLIRASEALHTGRVATRFAGIIGDARLRDWSAVVAQKDKLVSSLRHVATGALSFARRPPPPVNGVVRLPGVPRCSPPRRQRPREADQAAAVLPQICTPTRPQALRGAASDPYNVELQPRLLGQQP